VQVRYFRHESKGLHSLIFSILESVYVRILGCPKRCGKQFEFSRSLGNSFGNPEKSIEIFEFPLETLTGAWLEICGSGPDGSNAVRVQVPSRPAHHVYSFCWTVGSRVAAFPVYIHLV
jgi:hypothetical protein